MNYLKAFEKDLNSEVEPLRQSAEAAIELAMHLAEGERLRWFSKKQRKRELLDGKPARSVRPEKEGLILPYTLTVDRFWSPTTYPRPSCYVGLYTTQPEGVYSTTEKSGYKRVEEGLWKVLTVDRDIVTDGPEANRKMAMWPHLSALVSGKIELSDDAFEHTYFTSKYSEAIKRSIELVTN